MTIILMLEVRQQKLSKEKFVVVVDFLSTWKESEDDSDGSALT